MQKIYFLLISLCCIYYSASSQAGQWVWFNGSNTYNSQGAYGTLRVPNPTNNPPALYEPCQWTDSSGKFWMYGGVDSNAAIGIHNDLWKYDPITMQWTWMNGTQALNDHGKYGVQGVPANSNRPPGLGYAPASWTDLNGNLWMFGGWNDSAYADLWKYDISTNKWTWVNGPGVGNAPGSYGTQGVPSPDDYPPSRYECQANWTDGNGNLWLFGGYTQGGYYSDLWRYDVSINEWTWTNGSNLLNQKGSWGTMGVENFTNAPSARASYSHWEDNLGNLWMFGGLGFDSLNTTWALNDMWRYDIARNEWSWMGGHTIGDSSYTGIYGTKCTMAAANDPSPRTRNMAVWTDSKGNFRMFGGQYQRTASQTDNLNDLWMYCVSSNQWAWVSGDSAANQPGDWGTLGVYSPANKPSPRSGCPAWMDRTGHLYVFGGMNDSMHIYNDMWQFDIDTTCPSACNITSTCSARFAITGDTTQLHHYIVTNYSQGAWPISFVWSWGDGTYDSIPYPTHTYADTGFYTICLSMTDSAGCQSTFCDSSFHAMRTTNTMVYMTVVSPLTGTKEFSAEGAQTSIYPNPAANQLTIHTSSFHNEAVIVSIMNVLGQEASPPATLLEERGDAVIDVSKLAAGMYFLQLKSESGSVVKKFVKE